MKHLVYQTTNLLNDKIYVGVHSTENIDDGYMGSSRELWRSIRKNGKNNFLKEIVHECDSKEEAFKLEELIVNTEFVERVDTYNLREGGIGSYRGRKFSDETKAKMSKTRIEKGTFVGKLNPMFGRTHTPEARDNIRKAHRGKKWSPIQARRFKKTRTGMSSSWKGGKHKEETKKKISSTCSGRIHIKNMELKCGRYVTPEEFKQLKTQGWERGIYKERYVHLEWLEKRNN